MRPGLGRIPVKPYGHYKKKERPTSGQTTPRLDKNGKATRGRNTGEVHDRKTRDWGKGATAFMPTWKNNGNRKLCKC